MLKNKLYEYWNTHKFATSWIIVTPYLKEALSEIEVFSCSILGVDNLPIANNPDFRVIKRGLNSNNNEVKFINVDQIREIQSFLNNTASVSKYKIVVIYEADLMNLNSSNCCLKILEEAPRDSYIFLLTAYPGNIGTTIKSRCHRINLWDEITSHKNHVVDEDNYTNFVQMLQSTSSIEKMQYLQSVSAKNSGELWDNFCSNASKYLESQLKYSIGNNVSGIDNVISRLDALKKLMTDAINFDLDKRHVGILILECLV